MESTLPEKWFVPKMTSFLSGTDLKAIFLHIVQRERDGWSVCCHLKDIFGFYASVHYFLGIKIGFYQKGMSHRHLRAPNK